MFILVWSQGNVYPYDSGLENYSVNPGRGGVNQVLMKNSWIHSFCVAQQSEMGVKFNA